LLNQLPQDFAELLNAAWLDEKYGGEYYKLHAAACLKDEANNTARKLMASAVARTLAPDNTTSHPPIVSELSKLPLDYFRSADVAADFLRSLAEATKTITWMLKGAKQWHNMESKEKLLYSLAIWYTHHFGKLPSAANAGKEGLASPFRRFLIELSRILDCKLGADITREVLGALKKNRQLTKQ